MKKGCFFVISYMRIVKGRPLQDCSADLPRPLCLLPPQVPSFQKVANRVLTHSASLRYASFVHTLFAFTSGLARWPLSKLAGKQCKHSQLQSLRYRFADPPLCASACFHRRANRCSKHSFCKSRQRSASRCKLVVKK